jgi:predicted ATPase
VQEEISFGTWLRKQRRTLDLSQKIFASQVGCAEVTLRRIEAGTLKPSKELVSVLLQKLGIPEAEWPQWISFARGLTGFPLSSFPSPKKPKSNLPSSLTTFIGREEQQLEVIRLITKHRLVSLIGSGGVGKTRLSIKIGEQVLENYADGVWFVELASVLDPLHVPRVTAITLGLADEPQRPVIEVLCDFLEEKNMLIILDNCEHLLDACAFLTDTLLKNCPHLKVLPTSREAFGILGEAVYRVPSLGLPDQQQLIDKIRKFESVSLFEERAQLAQFDFSLTPENITSVAQICHRVDGIPLGIELAAAKVSILSTQQIAEQLDESINLLTGGSRTALPRHQTMRASMDWSWGMLTEAEQIVMRQLSVFVGGWVLDAAQAICDSEVLELMNSLVRKSLIVSNQKAGHETRYFFHETIRQYTREKLIQADEEVNSSTRHLRYFVELAERAEIELKGPIQTEWYSRLKDERDNIHVALRWAEQTDLEAGLYLASRLGTFWWMFDLRDGNYWLSRFLQRSESFSYPKARAKALYIHGMILGDLQQLDAAYLAAKECLELYRALGDQAGEVDGLLLLNWDAWLSATERIEHIQRAFELAQSLGDVPRQMDALWQLGYLARGNKKLTYWEKALGLARSSGNVRWLADHLSMGALELASNGDLDSAHKYLNESELLSLQFDMNPPPRDLFSAQGKLALIRGDCEQARTYFQDSAQMHLESANRHEYLWACVYLGYVSREEGKLDEARYIFSESAKDFQMDKHTIGVVYALEGMAGIYSRVNKTKYAVRLIGWADATREKNGEWRLVLDQVEIDRILADCSIKMEEAEFSDVYENGKNLTIDEAVTFALEN